MTTPRIIAVAVLIVASSLAVHMALSQQQGIKRTDLQRHDLSVPGREVVQVRVELAGSFVSQAHSSAVEGKASATSCLSRREKIQASEPSEVTRR